MANMGDLIIETTQSKYRLGLGLKLDARDTQRNLDRKMQMLGLLMDELGFVFTRQGKEENMKFGDVMIEYKNSLDPLKVVFNARTVKLMDYVDGLKYRNKKRDRADKLKLRLGINHPEVKEVMAEEVEAAELLEKSKQEFDDIQAKVKKEIQVFDTQKSKDLRKSIKDYVNLSIRYEKTKLQNLEKTLQDMQQPVIRSTSFFYQQQQQQQQEQSSISSSLHTNPEDDSSTTSTIHPSTRQKKRRQKQHLHQNYKELQKPLQSSASLPTRNRKNGNDSGGGGHDSDSSEKSLQRASTVIPRDDTTHHTNNSNRISMSASYDDRFLNTTWL